MTKKALRKKVESVFAKNLKTILNERGISQRAAAAIADVGTSTVNDWLAGVNPNDLQAVHKLAKGLQVDFAWLVLGIVPERIKTNEMALNEIFEIEIEPNLSGLFLLEAKRLKRRE